MGVGVGVCPHAVEQRANRIMPATAGPAILGRIQLRAIFLAMVLLFLFERGKDHVDTSGFKNERGDERAATNNRVAVYGG